MKQIIIFHIFILSFFSFNLASDKSTLQKIDQYMSFKVNGILMKSKLLIGPRIRIKSNFGKDKNEIALMIACPVIPASSPLSPDSGGFILINIINPKIGENNGFIKNCKRLKTCTILTYTDYSGQTFLNKNEHSYSLLNLSISSIDTGVHYKGTFSGFLFEDGTGNSISISDGKFSVVNMR